MSRYHDDFDYPFGRREGRHPPSEIGSSLGDLRRPPSRGPLPPPPGFGSGGRRLAPWSTFGGPEHPMDRKSKPPSKSPSKAPSQAEEVKPHKRELPLSDRISRAFEVFAAGGSIQGLGYVQSSPRGPRKFIWTIIFLGFLAVTFYQIGELTTQFLKRPVQTKITIKDAVVSFPSVTLCNLNIVRDSKVSMNPALENFIRNKQLDVEEHETAPPASANETQYSVYQYQYEEDDAYAADDFFQGTTDEDFALQTRFKRLIGDVDSTTRTEMGHQKELMIVDCVFNSKVCHPENFTLSLSGDYGNCYTFNSGKIRDKPLKTRFLGPEYGLSLHLFKEDNEYLESLTPGSGWRLVVHPFDTLPFPLVQGISLAPGMETFLGMSYTNVTRPGDPYDPCEKGTSFFEAFYAQYTLQSCQATCASRYVLSVCKCYLPEKLETYPQDTETNLNIPVCDANDPSSTGPTRKCATKETAKVVSGERKCGCLNPCTETNIVQEVSMNSWPDTGLLKDLRDKICGKVEMVECDPNGGECTNPTNDTCLYMNALIDQNADKTDKSFFLRDNFGAVNVFFKSLTTNIVQEEGSYTFSRFGSDIGGTVGLWLGLSIFSFVELLNFVGHIFKYIYYSCSGKKQEPDRFQQPRGRHPQYMRDFMGNMPPGPFPDDDYYQGPYRR